MKITLLLICIISYLSVKAYGIGRTGNKIYDDKEGFTASIPMEYSETQNMGNGNLRLVSRGYIGRGNFSPIPQELEILKTSTIFPEFLNQPRNSIKQQLLDDQWVLVENKTVVECLDFYRYESSSAIESVLLWGQSKGIVLRAKNSELNKHTVDMIISTLEVSPGACDWK